MGVSLVGLVVPLANCDDSGTATEPPASTSPLACQVIQTLEQRCALGGCHLPHNPRTALVLDRAAVLGGALAGHVVAGKPDESWLYRRMSDRSAGPLMPLGQAAPIPEVDTIRAWIAEGASLACDALPPPSDVYDPNHLDPEGVFACETPTVDASPARLRRVERREWTHAVVQSVDDPLIGSTARDNPFTTPDVLPYSTYARDVSVDPTTLDLYFLALPEAPASWEAADPWAGAAGYSRGHRLKGVYKNAELNCIHGDLTALTDEARSACIDNYVDALLRRGTLARTPTVDEQTRLRELLVATLDAEKGDASKRRPSLHYVGQAAFLMVGALFRGELGEPLAGDAADRRRLTADEMALALGHMLGSHPTGTPVPTSVSALSTTNPDYEAELGRMSSLRAAADDGTIFEPSKIRELFAIYQGGQDAARPDLDHEENEANYPARGDFWIAEGMLQFFREWLDYEGASSSFKDTPGGTSEYDTPDTASATTSGFSNLQSGRYGHESTLVEQLDDTIARAVVESHQLGEDVFRTLMTTRQWRLPSTVVNTKGPPCANDDDCQPPDGCAPNGLCGTSIAKNTATTARVYGVEIVEESLAGRWVELPDDQRRGVLTHPAWLAAHGGNFEDDASAVHRGRWIRERLFCETVPGLELVSVEAKLVPSDPSLSARARLVTSVEDPSTNPDSATCMGCHLLMNPLGYPFEIYNHAGFLRAFDHGPMGTPVAPSGASTITLAPESSLQGDVSSALDFAEVLADSRSARRCFIRHAFRYFMGRNETEGDACALAAMEASLDATGSFFRMVETLAASDVFQLRTLAQEDR